MSREVHVRFWEGLGLKCPGLLTISWNRTMAGGAGFPSITRKGAGNLGYCHLSGVLRQSTLWSHARVILLRLLVF